MLGIYEKFRTHARFPGPCGEVPVERETVGDPFVRDLVGILTYGSRITTARLDKNDAVHHLHSVLSMTRSHGSPTPGHGRGPAWLCFAGFRIATLLLVAPSC